MDVGLGWPLRDPLLCDIELPLQASFFPFGFRLEIATNAQDVLDAAAQAWHSYGPEYDRPPLTMRVVVQPEGNLAPKPVFRLQRRLLSVISDPNNFGTADLEGLFAAIYVSARTASDHTWLRWFFVESMAYMMLVQRYLVAIHAACIVRRGAGILLAGASGAGKSTLSFACARAGWTFVADDCVWLLADADDPIVIGKPHQARFREDSPQLFPELEGYISRARPNGKVSLEVPTGEFPHLRTAKRCPAGSIVFLERGAGRPGLEAVSRDEALTLIMRDMPTYGDEVYARHQRGIERLVAAAPRYRMRYQALEDALALLDTLDVP